MPSESTGRQTHHFHTASATDYILTRFGFAMITSLMYAQQHLLPPPVNGVKRLKALEAIGKMRGSCSSISFYWQMNGIIKGLGGHNVFLAEDYKVHISWLLSLFSYYHFVCVFGLT